MLDGHQRLSTLAGVLVPLASTSDRYRSDEDPGRWRVWYNAKNNSFEHLDQQPQEAHHFPLWKLMDTFAFLEECQRLMEEGGPEAAEIVRKVQELAEVFRTYKLPVIKIRSTELTQAVEIFARLNAKGQRMTADQIVSALAYQENEDGQPTFDLAAKIDELQEELEYSGFGGVDRTIVLRALLAALDEDIYRTDWTRIFTERSQLREKLPGVISRTKDALVLATQFLHSQGACAHRLVPYAMQLVVLSGFFEKCSEPSPAQRDLLNRWFWVSSFTGWFASGNPSRTRRLIEEVRRIGVDPAIGVRPRLGCSSWTPRYATRCCSATAFPRRPSRRCDRGITPASCTSAGSI